MCRSSPRGRRCSTLPRSRLELVKVRARAQVLAQARVPVQRSRVREQAPHSSQASPRRRPACASVDASGATCVCRPILPCAASRPAHPVHQGHYPRPHLVLSRQPHHCHLQLHRMPRASRCSISQRSAQHAELEFWYRGFATSLSHAHDTTTQDLRSRVASTTAADAMNGGRRRTVSPVTRRSHEMRSLHAGFVLMHRVSRCDFAVL